MDLTRAATEDLRALNKRLAEGRLKAPLTTASLKHHAHLAEHAPSLLVPTSTAVLLAALDATLAERATTRTEVELVWTGPDTVQSETRDTAQTLCELFRSARTEVIVAGYTFDHGRDLFAPLKTAMADRSVRATFFIDVPKPKTGTPTAAAEAARTATTFIQDNWPDATAPYPEFYFDPRTVGDAPYLSLHAKCVVVDRLRALVGSANFTSRGTERNLECGALIADAAFAGRLARQWMDLVSRRHMEPATPSASALVGQAASQGDEQ